MAEQIERDQSRQARVRVVVQPDDEPLKPAGDLVHDYTNEQTVGSVPMLLMDPFLTKTVCWPILAYHSAAQSTPYVQAPLVLRAVASLFTESKWIQCIESIRADNSDGNVLDIEWAVPSYVQQSVTEAGLPKFRDVLPDWAQASVRQGTMPAETLFGESRDVWPPVVRWRTYSTEPSDAGEEALRFRGPPLIGVLSLAERERYDAALDSLGEDRENTYEAIVADIRHTMRRRFRSLGVTLWSFPRKISSGESDLRMPAPLFLTSGARNISYVRWLHDFGNSVGDDDAEEQYIRGRSPFASAANFQRSRVGDIVFVQEPMSWPEGAVEFFQTHDTDGDSRPHAVPVDPRILYYIDRFLRAYNRVHDRASGAQWLPIGEGGVSREADSADRTEKQVAFLKHLAPVVHLLRITPHVPLPLGFTEPNQRCAVEPEPANAAETTVELRRYAKVLTTQIVGTPLITWALERRSPEEWRSVLFQISWTLCAFDTLSVSFGKVNAQSIVVQPNSKPPLAIYQMTSDSAFLVPLAEHNVCFTQFHSVEGVAFSLQRQVGQGPRRGRRQVYLQQLRADIGSPATSAAYTDELFGGSASPRSVVGEALNRVFSNSRAPFQFNAATREAILALHQQFTQFSVFGGQSPASQTLMNEFFTHMLTPQRSALVQFYQCALFEKYLVRLPSSDLAKHAMQTEALPVFAMPRTLDARIAKKRTDTEQRVAQRQRQERAAARRQQQSAEDAAEQALPAEDIDRVVAEEIEEEIVEPQQDQAVVEEGVDAFVEMSDAEITAFLESLGAPLPTFQETDAFEQGNLRTSVDSMPGSPSYEQESERDAFMREMMGRESFPLSPWDRPADDPFDMFGEDQDQERFDFGNLE